MNIRGKILNIYYSSKKLDPHDYRKSRTLFIFENGTANIINSLTGAAFLAGYASYLGASDQFIGIITAIPALAGAVQLLSPLLFENITRRKAVICFFALIFRTILSSMVLIPFLFRSETLRLAVLAVMYLAAFSIASFLQPAAANWIIDLTPKNVRGKYFGTKDSYVLTAVMLVNLAMGKLLDRFEQKGSELQGFVFVFSVIFILTIINFVFLSSIKEPPASNSEIRPDIRRILTVPFKDTKFRKVIILFVLWNIGLWIGGPFFSVYQVTGLELKYTYIMLMGIVSSVSSIAAVRRWGRLADKRSWTFTSKLSLGLLAICHLGWSLVDRNTAYYLMPVLFLLAGTAWSGINISLFNIQFELAPESGRTMFLGFNAAIGGVIGFLSSLVGSAIVGRLEDKHLRLFGIAIGNMQVVFALSGILIGVSVAFIHFFIKEKDGER